VGHKLPDKKQVKAAFPELYRFLPKKARMTRKKWKKRTKREEKWFLHLKQKENKGKTELFYAKKASERVKSAFLCRRTRIVYL
jgi:hypothetical protein